MRTDFVPKAVASVAICCAVYVALVVFDRLLTMRTLSSVGYFDALVSTTRTLDNLFCAVRIYAQGVNELVHALRLAFEWYSGSLEITFTMKVFTWKSLSSSE